MATSVEEWSALRTELVTTSAPELSNAARSACWALVGLTIAGALLHTTALVASWVSRRVERRFFTVNILGYRRPILSTLLPVIFVIHALLNLASIIGLLTDLSSARFRGRTNAIQEASYSLLICAGLLKTWEIAARLPSLSRVGLPRSRSIINPNLPPRLCNALIGLSFLLVHVLPIPCIVLTSNAIDRIDTLTPALVSTIDSILNAAGDTMVNLATQQIDDLEAAANTLAIHTRMLAGLHLLFTTATLTGFLVACFALSRSLRGQVSVFRDSLDYRYELAATKAKAAGITCLPPAHLPVRARYNELTSDTPLCGGGELAALALKYRDLHAEAQQVRLEAILIGAVAFSFLVLELCIVTDAFKYPTRTSLGSILLIAIQWASWSWAGIPGPLLAIFSCVRAFNPPPLTKTHVVDEHVGLTSVSASDQQPSISCERSWYPRF